MMKRMPEQGSCGKPPQPSSNTLLVYAPKTCCNPYPPFDEEAEMDIRLHNMGVDPQQYRNALRETNERNRVYLQKFCYVWYGVCLVSVLTLMVPILLALTAIPIRGGGAWLIMAGVHLPIFVCLGFICWAKSAGSKYRAQLVQEVWDPVMHKHGVGVDMWSDQKHAGPSIGFGVNAVKPSAAAAGPVNFCPGCGAQRNPSTAFCSACGRRF